MLNLISVKESAKQSGVSTQTIRRWIAAGDLPAVKMSARLYRIDPTDLHNLLTSMKG